MELNDKITFGKYKGKTIEQVIKIDAQYLQWAEENGIISFSNDLQETISINAEIQHIEFLREYCDGETNIEY